MDPRRDQSRGLESRLQALVGSNHQKQPIYYLNFLTSLSEAMNLSENKNANCSIYEIHVFGIIYFDLDLTTLAKIYGYDIV